MIKIAVLSSVLFLTSAAMADQALSYDAFLKTALQQNLDLKIESAKVETSRANATRVSIPPPMVGYMRMRDQSGSVANGYEISQTIPFPTKITNARSARNYEADAQGDTLKARENEIRAQAKLIYFNLWASQAKLTALNEKRSIIESHIRLTRASVRSDSFLQIHLLKAESDLDLLDNDLIAARQEIVEKESVAAVFLNQPPAGFHPNLEEPPITPIPSEQSLLSPYQLKAVKLNYESFKARESESKATWFPDLYLRYREMGQTQLMPETSEVMVGISLPFLFPWDTSAATGKATGERMQAELTLEKETRKIDSQKEILRTEARALKEQLDNIQQRLLPRAEHRMKLVHNLAPRDMATLQDHRETMEAFPDLKLKALDLRARYEGAVAELLKYEGDDK
jgi:outer membrane protein TolC